MQKLLLVAASAAFLSTAAYAADLSVISQSAPMAYVAPNDWTGFYAGVFAGVGAGDATLTIVPPGGGAATTITGNSSGAVGGIQVGADFQFDKFVIGAVADIAATSISPNASIGGGGFTVGYTSRLTYLGTLRARAGVTVTDDLLAYVHGGFAYGQTDPALTGGGAAPALGDVNRTGYTVGAGLEYRVTDSFSLQTEYAYYDLGTAGVSYTPSPGFPAGANLSESFRFHTVKAGVNFRF